MKENTEKVVVIFDRVDETAITVIESLGGEIQKQESLKDEQQPLIGKWVKFVGEFNTGFTKNKWYQCVKDPFNNGGAFIGNDCKFDGYWPYNDKKFNLTDARDYNPDEVKALVGKLVKHKESGEYHLFVECGHNGLEVEGVAVHAGDLTYLSNPIYSNYDLKDFKEKEVELLVPDNVKFYDWGGDIALEVSEGVVLCIETGHHGFVLTDDKDVSNLTPIKCKLIPVKYEDVQVGDFVVPKRGLHNKSRAYSMKHGEDKFCSAYFGSFKFNDVLAYKRAKILKVVKA